jgi:hypothetical protein
VALSTALVPDAQSGAGLSGLMGGKMPAEVPEKVNSGVPGAVGVAIRAFWHNALLLPTVNRRAEGLSRLAHLVADKAN